MKISLLTNYNTTCDASFKSPLSQILSRIGIKSIHLLRSFIYLLTYLHISRLVKDRHWTDVSNYVSLHRYVPVSIESPGIRKYSRYPAGIAIELRATSNEICIIGLYSKRDYLTNMTVEGSNGLDVYWQNDEKAQWITNLSPSSKLSMHISETISIPHGCDRVIVYLPSYAVLDKLFIRCIDGIAPHISEYNSTKPSILIYGSSISQGCSASRPGLSYGSIVARNYGMRLLNYGFSESAKGEKDIAKYIASLGADVYVLEYDHNATLDVLRTTHFAFYEEIRKANPDSLIIVMSRYSGGISISEKEAIERRSIIENTFNRALELGDEKIAYIPGSQFDNHQQCELFVDDRHPNDLGMNLIANNIMSVLSEYGHE